MGVQEEKASQSRQPPTATQRRTWRAWSSAGAVISSGIGPRVAVPLLLVLLLAFRLPFVCTATGAADLRGEELLLHQAGPLQQEQGGNEGENDGDKGAFEDGNAVDGDGASFLEWEERMSGNMEWMASTAQGAWALMANAGAATQDMLTSSCTYYEDVVGPGTCEDLAHAILATRDALHCWGRVLLAVVWAFLVLLYENPIILAIVGGLFALYLAMRWMLRLAQRAVVLYHRFLAWVGRHLPIVATALPITAFVLVWSYALTFPAMADALEWPLTAVFVARIWPLCMSVVTIVQLEDIAPAPPVC